ncbi:hypothetical protein ACPCAG_30750 [Streptomyces pseudogriseolus]|uniref:hypothetical protein n=1 Tax=Streptomyces pseudogriseolus TaxID=36817 RepID=UPI003FA2415D
MSDPACSSCPVAELEPAELISDGTCCRARARFQGVLLVLIVLNLVATVAFGVLGLVENDSSSAPSPTPTPTPTSAPPTTAAPDPTAEPTSEPGGSNGGSESGGTTPAPPSPTDGGSGGCGGIFDPECSGTSGGIGG